TGRVFTAVPRALAWSGPGQRVTVRVEHGARYSTVPILLLDAALIVAADAYARRWWPRPRAVAAVAALVAVLAAGWATDFRYPVRRFSGGPASTWAQTADEWLRQCQRSPTGRISLTFQQRYGVTTAVPCASLRRCPAVRASVSRRALRRPAGCHCRSKLPALWPGSGA